VANTYVFAAWGNKGDDELDLFDVGRACARRWYVFLPLMLIVGWYAHSAYSSAIPIYYSSTVVGLAPPNSRVEHVEAGVPLPRNGLLDSGGATMIANMTAIGLQQPAVLDRVAAEGGLPDFFAKMVQVPPSVPQPPLIMIEITTAKRDSVTKTLELATAQAEVTLRSLQQAARVPEDQMVQMFVVAPPTPPAGGMPSRMKSTLMILVAGAGLAVVFTVVLDVVLIRLKTRLQQRRKARSEGAAPPESSEPLDEVREPVNSAPVAGSTVEAI
jgi:hypothetical protein